MSRPELELRDIFVAQLLTANFADTVSTPLFVQRLFKASLYSTLFLNGSASIQWRPEFSPTGDAAGIWFPGVVITNVVDHRDIVDMSDMFVRYRARATVFVGAPTLSLVQSGQSET